MSWVECEQTCGRKFCVGDEVATASHAGITGPDIQERSCSLSLCTLTGCEDDVLTRRRELPRQGSSHRWSRTLWGWTGKRRRGSGRTGSEGRRVGKEGSSRGARNL